MLKKILFVPLFLVLFVSYSNSQWIKTNGPNSQYIYSLLLYGNSLYAATTDGIFATSNNGTTWVPKNNGINIAYNNIPYCLMSIGSKLFCGADSGVYVSTNNGDSWTRKNNGLPAGFARKINAFMLYNGTDIYLGTDRGVFLSTDSGELWVARNTAIESYIIYSFTVKDDKIYAGTDKKIFRSSDGGLTWTALSTGFPSIHTSVKALVTMGPNIIAGMCCGVGAHISTDDGERWEKVHDMTAYTLIKNGTRIIAGGIEGVLVSTDNGVTWTERNDGLQYYTTTALAYNAAKIYAGVELFVWYRPVGDLIGVNKISSEVPVQYSLAQNYPNPFNPSTNINFALPKESEVILKIFDVSGREVAEPVNEILKAGEYNYRFDAANLSSGMYFYTIRMDNFVETKKMVLVK